ncbi:MAG: glycosyl hydrolase [Candidatus Woesebacteria bacterium]|jgi:hypothetical protein
MLTKKDFFNFLILAVLLMALPVSVYMVNKATNFIGEATGERADLEIDLGTSESMAYYPWRNIAQGGEERGGMLESVKEPTLRLKPDYIRIDHIYDFYEPVIRNPQGGLEYDWTYLDEEIEDILDTGAKPFISISYMPGAIASQDELSPPNDWGEWQRVVQQTIEHISGRDNLAITDVYYEVWNEPDLFGDYSLSGKNSYKEMYYHAVRGAQSARDVYAFKIGGPATTALYRNWFVHFLDWAESEDLWIDFYSWHRYSQDLGDYLGDIERINAWLEERENQRDLELIISEFGPTPEVDSVYDNEVSAAHLIAVNLATREDVGKNFVFELKDGPSGKKYWGRWGLLTHERHGTPAAKPRYKAMEMLTEMEGNQFKIEGEGTWVRAFAAGDGEKVKLLIVNFDPNDRHVESVPIRFKNLPSESVDVKKQFLDGGRVEMQYSGVVDGWSMVEFLAPNDAVLIELDFK